MKISIITATYNSAATVADTLACISQQSYPDIEHIVVDGLSKDNTLELVGQYPHIARVISEKDKGIYDAMNKGVRAASGEVIGILNSDDIYTHPEVLEKVMKTFEDPAVDAVYGDLQYVHPRDMDRIIRTWKAGPYRRKNFYYGWMPPHPSFFVRRRLYDELGYFNLELRTAADYEIVLRFLFRHHANVKYIPEILVKMRTGGASNAGLLQRLRANREDRLAWKINGLKPWLFTLTFKPLRKINQFIIK